MTSEKIVHIKNILVEIHREMIPTYKYPSGSAENRKPGP
jgi:hypothetical protein